MRKYGKKIAAFLCILCAIHLSAQVALGAEFDDADAHELILLFDTSTSMSWHDTAFLAPDALQQIAAGLPAHWRLGLVTFNAEVLDVVPPDTDTRAAIHTILEGVAYTGFTNAGAGLLRAADLFSDKAANRTIIFVTDGEMAMLPTADATADAVYLAEQAIAQIIASGIRVHTMSVGTGFESAHAAILGLARETGGYLFQDLSSAALSETASTLIFDVLGVAGRRVGAAQTLDAAGRFTIRLPATGLNAATVLITAESAIEHIVVSGQGDSIGIQRGRRFARVEIIRPTERTIHIEFIAPGASEARLQTRWDLTLMAELGHGDSTRFWIADSAGENVFLTPFFRGNFFPIPINETYAQGPREMDTYIGIWT